MSEDSSLIFSCFTCFDVNNRILNRSTELLFDYSRPDLLGLLVQLEVVQDDGDEERHDDESDEEVVKDEVNRNDHGQAGVNLKRETKLRVFCV